jgi:hypothetical protein
MEVIMNYIKLILSTIFTFYFLHLNTNAIQVEIINSGLETNCLQVQASIAVRLHFYQI